MSFLDALAARPWLPQPAPAEHTPRPAAAIGLHMLIAVIAVLFGLFVLAVVIRSQQPDWQALVDEPGAPLANAAPLWVNTALLAMSSLALQAAASASRHGRVAVRSALALAGCFALAFLVGQGLVWRQFVAHGHFVASHPAASFFYLLTGLHGLHLAGGLVAWARVTLRAWRAPPSAGADPAVALCARYWHFLLAVWLVLFALLASPPATLGAIAEFCGVR
ncbi:cytochrome c oxidase subunit 3 [Azoarcus sp. KH32C]|uniref:cytochrome c oxidase subunit 3 n=1 Tax=Azoarcus sp. KH32C TaxID=748247 RepID=UPI000238646A|nr:cytochrome c oxidase subunit 3 [Azoarcus sp. KH32C]BAL22528.1 cytochrome c oxidase, subunit III oxidoreductase protein [Azoarcus sp. KH32C]